MIANMYFKTPVLDNKQFQHWLKYPTLDDNCTGIGLTSPKLLPICILKTLYWINNSDIGYYFPTFVIIIYKYPTLDDNYIDIGIIYYQ